jgi:hypothetical protein
MRIALILVVMVLIGCRHARPEARVVSATSLPFTIYEMQSEITLTRSAPHDQRGFRLLRVEPDGRTVIRVDRTRETISAMPGEAFLGRPDRNDIRIFGNSGLTLKQSDPTEQSAVFELHWAEYSE